MTKRKQTIWKVIMLLYLLAVAYVCFIPGDQVPQMPQWNLPVPMDKIIHFSLFLPFPIVAFFAFNVRHKLVNIGLLLLTGIALAGLTEIIQSFSPTRSMEATDFLADCLGVTFSCLLLTVLRKTGNGGGK